MIPTPRPALTIDACPWCGGERIDGHECCETVAQQVDRMRSCYGGGPLILDDEGGE
ncbi:MAG: hypothetical protein WAT39_03210 [Planctomycetota bacterium]